MRRGRSRIAAVHGPHAVRPRAAFAWLAAMLLLSAYQCPSNGAGAPTAEGRVEIAGQAVEVEIADSRGEQAKGLGERDGLAWDTGMYFPYARPGFYAFWMKGMRFSIDIVFIREGRIVEIHPNVPFERGGNGPTIQARSLVDAVLEVPAGYAQVRGWKPGDRVRFERASEG